MRWIRTSWSSIKNSLSRWSEGSVEVWVGGVWHMDAAVVNVNMFPASSIEEWFVV